MYFFIIPKATIISQILYLIPEQNGTKCVPPTLSKLASITGGYWRDIITNYSCLAGNNVEWLCSFLLLLLTKKKTKKVMY